MKVKMPTHKMLYTAELLVINILVITDGLPTTYLSSATSSSLQISGMISSSTLWVNVQTQDHLGTAAIKVKLTNQLRM